MSEPQTFASATLMAMAPGSGSGTGYSRISNFLSRPIQQAILPVSAMIHPPRCEPACEGNKLAAPPPLTTCDAPALLYWAGSPAQVRIGTASDAVLGLRN